MLELYLAKEFDGAYLPFRDVWFEVSLSDLGAFHITLGNAVTLGKLITDNAAAYSSAESNKLYAQSLAQLRQRIGNAKDLTSQGIIANILGHVCWNVRRGHTMFWWVM